MTPEEETRLLCHRRGIDDLCPACRGWGVRTYGSTATWRGGMGGAMMTLDVCDKCWGTGDEHRHGTDIRALEAQRAAWEKEQCLQYFARVTGCNISSMAKHIIAMADILAANERKRKIPAGFDEFWWKQSLHAVSSSLRRLAGDGNT